MTEPCTYCGERCFDGEGCDEHNADGFSEQGYTVSWSIYADASSPRDAIEQALGILADPDITATVFVARRDDGRYTVIDTDGWEVLNDEQETP